LGRHRECSGPPEEQRELTGETHRIWLTQHKSRENGVRREITQICPQEERELPGWVEGETGTIRDGSWWLSAASCNWGAEIGQADTRLLLPHSHLFKAAASFC